MYAVELVANEAAIGRVRVAQARQQIIVALVCDARRLVVLLVECQIGPVEEVARRAAAKLVVHLRDQVEVNRYVIRLDVLEPDKVAEHKLQFVVDELQLRAVVFVEERGHYGHILFVGQIDFFLVHVKVGAHVNCGYDTLVVLSVYEAKVNEAGKLMPIIAH